MQPRTGRSLGSSKPYAQPGRGENQYGMLPAATAAADVFRKSRREEFFALTAGSFMAKKTIRLVGNFRPPFSNQPARGSVRFFPHRTAG
jgi:hypothetical protein